VFTATELLVLIPLHPPSSQHSSPTDMEHNKQKKKVYKGDDIVRFEPQGLQLLDSNPIFRESFRAVGCLTFFENLQGGHMEVAK